MKKACAVLLIVVMILGLATTGYCDVTRKLCRGISNLATWPLEIPNRMIEADKRGGVSVALTYGMLEGACMTVVRFAAGLWETVTFLIPVPKNYEPMITDPEFFIQLSSEDAKTHIFKR